MKLIRETDVLFNSFLQDEIIIQTRLRLKARQKKNRNLLKIHRKNHFNKLLSLFWERTHEQGISKMIMYNDNSSDLIDN